MAWLGDDPWDRPRRPAARQLHTGDLLDPFSRAGGGMYRTRSVGNQPQPIVVINDISQDANARGDSIYPPSPPPRGRRVSDRLSQELLQEQLAELKLERRMRSRSREMDRSRSHGRSDASSNDFYRLEYERLEREREWKERQARIEAEAQVKRQREGEDRQRVISDYERKQREAADKAKADEQRLIEKMDRQKREQKEAERRIKEKLEREDREAAEEEKRQWQEFERKQAEKKAKKEQEEKEDQARLDEAMRKRLREAGVSEREISAIMDRENAKNTKTTTTTTTLIKQGGHQPVYAKIHRDYLSVETLRYYSIPWEYDDRDSNYIIVLREMDKHETNILFNHTKALRAGRLLIEAPKEQKAYAFYRKPARSKSRNREDGWKKFGILEFKR